MYWLAVLFALLITATGDVTADERLENVKTAAVEMILPRLPSRNAIPELRKVLERVPTLTFSGPLFPFSFRNKNGVISGLTIRIEFDPAMTDVGYIAKTIAKTVATVMPKNKQDKQPLAILMIRTDARNEQYNGERQFLWKELSSVEGVNVEDSRQMKEGNIVGIVLDETGKARLKTIIEAFEAASVKVLKP